MLDRYALASFALRTDRRIVRSAPPSWPIPAFEGHHPVVIDTIDHGLGVELAFERSNELDFADKYPPGGRNGTERHFMPNLWPALAVSDGVIAYAGRQKYGNAVLIDHRNGWATYYANLAHMFPTPTDGHRARHPRVVCAGQILGFIGAPYPGAMKCLRFELWSIDRDGCVERVNPRRYLYRWQVSRWGEEPKTEPEHESESESPTTEVPRVVETPPAATEAPVERQPRPLPL
jgi:hypothetical protein